MSDRPKETDGPAAADVHRRGARLFAAGNLADEETQRERATPPQSPTPPNPPAAPPKDNFNPRASTRLVSELSDAPRQLAEAPTRLKTITPPPRSSPSAVGDLASPSGAGELAADGFRREAPTRLTNPASDEGGSEIELSVSDADFVGLDVDFSSTEGSPIQDAPAPAPAPAPAHPAPAQPAPAHSGPPRPRRSRARDDTVEILHTDLPEPGAPRLPTGFIDRARIEEDASEARGPRPVPQAPAPAPRAPVDPISNPFRAVATTVDMRSISDDSPALSELDVDVDDSLLAQAPQAPPAYLASLVQGDPLQSREDNNPLTSTEDRMPTQNIRIELEAEAAAERAHAYEDDEDNDDDEDDDTVDLETIRGTSAPVAEDAVGRAPDNDDDTGSYGTRDEAGQPVDASAPPAATTAIMREAPLQDDIPNHDAARPEMAAAADLEPPRTQTEFVPDESLVGPPDLARWKVVPTSWGEASDEAAPRPPTAPESPAPKALKTLMWNIGDEEEAESGPEHVEAPDPRRYRAQADRAATDGSTAIAANYLGDCLNHLEEIGSFQAELEQESGRALHAKVFAAQQKLRQALALLGARAYEDTD